MRQYFPNYIVPARAYNALFNFLVGMGTGTNQYWGTQFLIPIPFNAKKLISIIPNIAANQIGYFNGKAVLTDINQTYIYSLKKFKVINTGYSNLYPLELDIEIPQGLNQAILITNLPWGSINGNVDTYFEVE